MGILDIFKYIAADGEKGIKKEEFHRLRMSIGIAREKVQDAARKKAREEKEQKLKEMKADLQEKVEEQTKALAAFDEQVVKAEEAASSLTAKLRTESSCTLLKLADEAQELVKDGKEELTKLRTEATGLSEGVDDSL